MTPETRSEQWKPADFYWVTRAIWVKTPDGGADADLDILGEFSTCREAVAVAKTLRGQISVCRGVRRPLGKGASTLGKLWNGEPWAGYDAIERELELEAEWLRKHQAA